MEVITKTDEKQNRYESLKIAAQSDAIAIRFQPAISFNKVAVGLLNESQSIFWRMTAFLDEYILSNLTLLGELIVFTNPPSIIAARFREAKSSQSIPHSVKRVLDILGATIGLLLSAPIFVLLPILIKLDSPGPIFYRQLRVGMNRRRLNRRAMGISLNSERRNSDRRNNHSFGKPFTIYKFRTMRQDAEKNSGPTWASKNDPRITRLGQFLRLSRLDEIPQLFNVLKGDMSLVGPRPERPFFVEKLVTEIDSYDARLQVKPGITGLAQVEHGYDQTLDDVRKKVHFDLEYIRRWNVFRDLKIMLKTVVVMVAGKGM